MWIAPAADVSDGEFSVVQVSEAGKRFWLQHAAKVYAGTHTKLKEVQVGAARTVRAEPLGRSEVLIDLDGEQPGRLPASFDILPAALTLIV